MKILLATAAVCSVLMAGCRCSGDNGVEAEGGMSADSLVRPKYATGYQVKDSAGVRLVTVGDYRFALTTADNATVPDGYTKIHLMTRRMPILPPYSGGLCHRHYRSARP